MSDKTTKEKIAVMQAFMDGKKLQILSNDDWTDWNPTCDPVWNWERGDYRIKPERREWWANEYPVIGRVYIHDSLQHALQALGPDGVTIKVREVNK